MAKFPTVRTPTIEEVLDIAEGYGMTITVEDAESYRGLMEGTIASYHRLDDLDEPKLPVKYPRSTGYRPPPEENPYNAWYWKSEVKGRGGGPLKGKRVVLKDNICLAGVPMMNGATVLEGYVPDIDATVVTRILDAGGTIIGKAANTYLCFDGGSATTATGMVENPHKKGYTSGGSSAGSGVLVAIGEADMALGGDQGGSIRMPACWCGIYGHKPTHGTGSLHRDLPHRADPRPHRPDGALGERRGGPAPARSGPRQRFTELGATVDEISIPMHLDGPHIWNGIAVEGATAMMLKGNGFGTNWEGYYATSLIDAYARGWRSRPDDLSETVKTVMMLGEYMHRNYHGRYYAKAQNLSRRLRETYDAVLAEYDVLAMPTLPMLATELPAPDCSREHYVDVALNMLANTCPFDATGHPAMTVPCGKADDSPIGMMLIGKRYDDATVIQAAAAFETLGVFRT
ncbi:Amidase [Geodia barretti]|uniref:Amidase n=1 Tax=Geodia barretti TaxID=519541 RepID=A0AA35XCG4_GEOBA|nr:Amidase [Geodia barretti]